MRYNYHVDRRRSIRLPTYDYTEAGAYFLTVCTHNRQLVLGERLVREIVSNAWHELPRRFSSVRLDDFVIMPNHIHGIIWIVKREPPVGAQLDAWPKSRSVETPRRSSEWPSAKHHAAPLRLAVEPGSLGAIVRAFKSRAAKRINRLGRHAGCPDLATQLLRTHHPRRWRPRSRPPIHHRQSRQMGRGRG